MLLCTRNAAAQIQKVAKEEELRAHEWKYYAEGGANIVFRYIGAHQPLQNQILRLPKVIKEAANSPPETVDFITNHLQPLLNDNRTNKNLHYHQVAQVISVSKELIANLQHQLEKNQHTRPQHRQTTQLNLDAKYGLLLPLIQQQQKECHLEPICIELKPKNSHLPTLETLPSLKQSICRYCMHQHLKLHQGKIETLSSYCPLDLFSAEFNRQLRAIRALQQTPQNNFRIVNTADMLDHAIEERLRLQEDESKHEFSHLLTAILDQVKILNDIAQLHQLDRVDIDGLWHLHLLHQAIAQWEDRTIKLHDIESELELPLHRVKIQAAVSAVLEIGIIEWEDIALEQVDNAYKHLVQEFFIATTIKDCSILISIRRVEATIESISNKEEHEILFQGRRYAFSAAIIDLDKKPLSKLPHYYRMDAEIIDHYTSSVGIHRSTCSNSIYLQRQHHLHVKKSRVPLPSEVCQVSGNMKARLLYPNPVCLLSVYDHLTNRSNVMPITWITPIDNEGGFILSINKQRYTASFINEVGKSFVLNIPSVKMKDVIVQLGACSGRKVNKFQEFKLETCCPGWYPSPVVVKKKHTTLSRKQLKAFELDEKVHQNLALVDCIAHVLSVVTKVESHNNHWVLTCNQLTGWCLRSYFASGKTFIARDAAPYLTFLGSQTFGVVVPENT